MGEKNTRALSSDFNAVHEKAPFAPADKGDNCVKERQNGTRRRVVFRRRVLPCRMYLRYVRESAFALQSI